MKERWALVVMGAWLAGSICSSVVATENFYTIDRLLAGSSNAAFSHAVRQLGQPQARDLLRYLSSELNRLYFQIWNWSQLVLGVLVLWLLAGSTQQDPAYTNRRAGPFGPAAKMIVAMLAVVVLVLVYLTP